MIKKYITLLLVLLFPIFINGQNKIISDLESLYQKNILEDETDIKKCGFPEKMRAYQYLRTISENEKQPLMKKYYSRPQLHKSIVSPKGYFRIHFDTTGTGKLTYDVNELAREADYCMDYYTKTLKYSAPPVDDMNGGDNLYDIYLKYLNAFGETTPEEDLGNEKFTSFITLRNDYSTTPRVKGLDAVKITIAHELHHAIQIGNYQYLQEIFFHELTSTTMEDIIYDYVDDYNNPQNPDRVEKFFSKFDKQLLKLENNTYNDGYNATIFGLFLTQKYGIGIIKKIWDGVPKAHWLASMNMALESNNSDFAKTYNEFGIWCFFSGERAVSGKYFKDAVKYPTLKAVRIKTLEGNYQEKINLEPLSNTFICFSDASNPLLETILMYSNGNYGSILDKSHSLTETEYLICNAINSTAEILENGHSFQQITKLPGIILNTIYVKDNLGYRINNKKQISSVDYPYPQPFNYGTDEKIFIPINDIKESKVELKLFNVAMETVYEDEITPEILGEKKGLISFVPGDRHKNKLASGVYIYIIKNASEIIKGKIVVINAN